MVKTFGGSIPFATMYADIARCRSAANDRPVFARSSSRAARHGFGNRSAKELVVLSEAGFAGCPIFFTPQKVPLSYSIIHRFARRFG